MKVVNSVINDFESKEHDPMMPNFYSMILNRDLLSSLTSHSVRKIRKYPINR